MNELWDLHWPVKRLQQVAATLGADMPFCVAGGYARGTGYGERIETFASQSPEAQSLRSQGFAGPLVVGAYQSQLSTPEVYAAFDQIGAGDGDANHLQKASISLHPRSGQAIESAVKAGATHAFVSGSGPSVVAFTPTAAIRRAVIEAWKRSACVDRIIAASAPAVPSVSRHGNAIQ